jgi:hypothetical protein
VSKSRPFRSLRFYKSNGKHAAPKGYVPEARRALDGTVAEGTTSTPRRPAHAATMPRPTGPQADRNADEKATPTEKQAA